jgi:hypothetical protein
MFRLAEEGEFACITELIHPDARITPVTAPEQRDAAGIREYLEVAIPDLIYHDVQPYCFEPVADDRVAVHGQLRWEMPRGGFKIFTATWALVFKDGLLYRGWPCESLEEAKRQLAVYEDELEEPSVSTAAEEV